MKSFFMTTKRIGFSKWESDDVSLAVLLWGDKEVTKFLCANGTFTTEEVIQRLQTELHNERQFQVQYWPMFDIVTNEFIGCCGVRPFSSENCVFEFGCHLRKNYWGKGFAIEAGEAVINHCFTELHANKIYAGHHPQNSASKKILMSLGFQYLGTKYYEPTGLYHPSYEVMRMND